MGIAARERKNKRVAPPPNPTAAAGRANGCATVKDYEALKMELEAKGDSIKNYRLKAVAGMLQAIGMLQVRKAAKKDKESYEQVAAIGLETRATDDKVRHESTLDAGSTSHYQPGREFTTPQPKPRVQPFRCTPPPNPVAAAAQGKGCVPNSAVEKARKPKEAPSKLEGLGCGREHPASKMAAKFLQQRRRPLRTLSEGESNEERRQPAVVAAREDKEMTRQPAVVAAEEDKEMTKGAKILMSMKNESVPEEREVPKPAPKMRKTVTWNEKVVRKLIWPGEEVAATEPEKGVEPQRAEPARAPRTPPSRLARMEREVEAYYERRRAEAQLKQAQPTKQEAYDEIEEKSYEVPGFKKTSVTVCDCEGDMVCTVCRAGGAAKALEAKAQQMQTSPSEDWMPPRAPEDRAELVRRMEALRDYQRGLRQKRAEGRAPPKDDRKVRLHREGGAQVLPPRSEVWVPVELCGPNSERIMTCVVEGSKLHTHSFRVWRMARGIIHWSGSGAIYVRVVNASNETVRLPPDVMLGTWEMLDEATVLGVNALSASAGMAELPVRRPAPELERSEPVGREALAENIEERCQHLSEQQREVLTNMLYDFENMARDHAGRTGLVQHVIDTGTTKPIRGARYRMSHTEEQKVREIVEDMEKKQVIRPSRSPWGASVVLVPKKCGGTRFCVDYRRLNEQTIKDVYPLPRIDATLDQLGGAKYFTTLDLTAGFWQVELAQGSAEKTAFTTPLGLYEFQVMPFGLCNAPATFQRLMDSVIGHLGKEFVLVYLDDVLIFSRTFEEHVEHLREVLTCIRDANLCIKLKKCFFAQLRTQYLGHIISGDGIEPDPGKLAAVKELLPPKNVKEVRGFIGFVGFYRRFVQDFSKLAKPLHELTCKNHTWEWTQQCQESFEALKQALLIQPVLKAPDFTKPFTIRCDASYQGLGAVLTQGEDEERRVVSYASRTLKDAETRYTATEIECLGMKWAVAHFRPYIHGTRFTLETDHVALTWLRTVQHSNARLIRTALALQDLDMKIVHKAGATMHDADALSRLRRKKGGSVVPEVNGLAESEDEGGDKDDDRYWSDECIEGGSKEGGRKPGKVGQVSAALCVTDESTGVAHERKKSNKSNEDRKKDVKERKQCILATCTLPVETGDCPKGGRRKRACCVEHYREWKKSERTAVNAEACVIDEEEEVEGEGSWPQRIREMLAEHPLYSKVLELLEGGELPEEEITDKVRRQKELLVARDGLLYRVDQLYRGGRAAVGSTRLRLLIPPALRKDVLFACHDHLLSGGHLGVQRTFDKIRARYYWAGLYRDVQEWCTNCRECTMRKERHDLRLPVMSVPIPAEPWEFVSVDVMGPFVSARGSGNKFIVVYCDHLTRYVETIAMRVQDTKSLARGLVERVMCRHGCPRVLLSDRGLPFLSELAHEVYRLLRVSKLDTAGYRPQTNGLVERFNQTFATMLSMYVNSRHNDWDVYLPYLTFAYNTGVHPATKETPFYLVHGREPRMPLDVQLLPRDEHCQRDVEEYRAELVEGLQVAREYGRESLMRDQQRRSRPPAPTRTPPTYQPGDQVLVRLEPTGRGMSKKLQLRWVGPFRVVRSIGNGGRTYGVKDNRGVERPVNVLRMKRFSRHTHPTVSESDYADHFASAGEALVSEGNRGLAPNREESKDEVMLEEKDSEVEIVDEVYDREYQQQGSSQATQQDEWQGDNGLYLSGDDEPHSQQDGQAGVPDDRAGDGDGSEVTRNTWSEEDPSTQGSSYYRVPGGLPDSQDLTPRGLRLRGADADGGATPLCSKCHAGRRGHKCNGTYQPVRQAVVNERRRGKDPENHVPHFGIALRKRGQNSYTIRGVFAPYDLRVMDGELEKFEDLVREKEGREAEVDDWNDYCEVCQKTGGVTMCLGCNLVFHERCLVTKIIAGGLRRNEELVCPDCVREMSEKRM